MTEVKRYRAKFTTYRPLDLNRIEIAHNFEAENDEKAYDIAYKIATRRGLQLVKVMRFED